MLLYNLKYPEMPIYQLSEHQPVLHETAFCAPDASLIGQVEMQESSSVWFNSVIRADNAPIIIGPRSNVQDLSVLHTDPGISLVIGRDVTIGHKVMLHGCHIADNVLVGINSVILNNAKIGRNTIIGANSLIAENKAIPEGVLVLGSPGRVIRELTDDEIKAIQTSAETYVNNASRYQQLHVV